MPSIGDRLTRAKEADFVGRDAEKALFREALTAPEPPFCVLSLHGSGGIGKTTLLRTFASLCAAEKIPHAALDARNVEPSPVGFTDALRAAMNLPPGTDPLETLAVTRGRRVLFVDTYEQMAALDGWLRDVFVPTLSADVLVVLSGRQPLSPSWLSDAGWRSVIRCVSLQNLDGTESHDYLTRRAVPENLHRAALDFTHGHPLALSLVADVFARSGAAGLGFAPPESSPGVVQTLLERFIEAVPSPAHRSALESCALLRLTDEAILREMVSQEEGGVLGREEARALFEWLRGLSFIETTSSGLFPHDVVRESLLADLRWRDRDRYVELHRRARGYFASRLAHASPREQQRLLYDCIFLHRDSAVVRAAFTWQESQSAYPDTLRPADRPVIRELVLAHEGPESAALAEYWMERQPEQTTVFRDLAEPDAARPVGFFTMLSLQKATPEERAQDPAVAAAWRYLERFTPLRAGESASHLRFWMGRDSYQNPSPVQSLLIVHALRHFLTHSHLAFTFFACADPDLWEPVFEHVQIARLPDAEYTIDGRHYGVFGHDWRAQPASEWLEQLYEREVAAGGAGHEAEPTRSATPAPPPLLILSEQAFAAAVRDALKNLFRSEALCANPLLRSRVLVARVGPNADFAARADALHDLIQDRAARLQSSPKQARGYRALHRTYLEPAPTQEQAAELLDLPFNTYRRHLGEGITALTQLLWREEVGRAAEP
jgi:hypothetical protein